LAHPTHPNLLHGVILTGFRPGFKRKESVHGISGFRSGVKASGENTQPMLFVQASSRLLTIRFLINQTKLRNSDSSRHKTRSILNTNLEPLLKMFYSK
jgi:hypothetical protein